MKTTSRRALYVSAAFLALAMLLSPAVEARKVTWSRTQVKASKGKISAKQIKSNGTRRTYVRTNKGSYRSANWKLRHGTKASASSLRNARGKVVASRRATVGKKGYTVRTRVGNRVSKIQKKANGTRRASVKTPKVTVSTSRWNLKNGVKASSTSIKNAAGKVIASKRTTRGKNGSTIKSRVGNKHTTIKTKYDPKTNTASALKVERTPSRLHAQYGAVTIQKR